MRDLYKQLGVGESATAEEIRAALGAADPTTRGAAELVLLDPARREVYDRNRRVLVTVGRLRGHLGLNLTRFWPRSRFADFTVTLAPPVGAGAGRRIDPMAVAWAFGVRPASPAAAHGPHRAAPRTIAIILAVAVVLAVAAAVVWMWR
jgi:hypothetical protein